MLKIKLNYTSKRMWSLLHILEPILAWQRFSVSGEWDFSIVIIAKDPIDMGKITSEIKFKFGKMILHGLRH